MSSIKYFATILNTQTIVVTLLALGSTYLCSYFEWQAEIPAGLIGLAVVFPIVFSINAAYRRREEALRYFGGLKAHAVALYMAHRDWTPGDDASHAERARDLVGDLHTAILTHFKSDGGRNRESFAAVYGTFSRFSASLEQLR